ARGPHPPRRPAPPRPPPPPPRPPPPPPAPPPPPHPRPPARRLFHPPRPRPRSTRAPGAVPTPPRARRGPRPIRGHRAPGRGGGQAPLLCRPDRRRGRGRPRHLAPNGRRRLGLRTGLARQRPPRRALNAAVEENLRISLRDSNASLALGSETPSGRRGCPCARPAVGGRPRSAHL